MNKKFVLLVLCLISISLIVAGCGQKNGNSVESGFNISFVSDGEVFYAYKFKSGEAVSFPDTVPQKADDKEYTYKFAGWSLKEGGETVSEGAKVTKDTVYYAVFEAVPKAEETVTYTVEFVDGLTGTLISSVRVPAGDAAVAPEAPEHEGYTFIGWDKEFDEIVRRTEVTALYEKNIHEFKISVLGNVSTQNVAYGDELDPGRAMTVEGLIFEGWFADEDKTTAFADAYPSGMPDKDVVAYAGYAVDLRGSSIVLPERCVYGGESVAITVPDYSGVEYAFEWSDGTLGREYSWTHAGAATVSVNVIATYEYVGGAVVTEASYTAEAEVEKARLDIKVSFSDAAIAYGTIPEAIFEASGFVGTDEAELAHLIFAVYKSGSEIYDGNKLPAGDYMVTADGSALTDYECSSDFASLKVNKAELTVSVVTDSSEYVYGETPQFTCSFEGFVFGEDAGVLSGEAVFGHAGSTEPGGTYSVGTHVFTAEGYASDNYTFNYVSASVTIAKAALEVTVYTDKAEYVYGEIPVPGYSIEGFVAVESESVLGGAIIFGYEGKLSSTGLFAAGEHSVTASGFVSDNYDIAYSVSEFSVTRKPLIGNVVAEDIVYGDALRYGLELNGFERGESIASLGASPVYEITDGLNFFGSDTRLPVGEYTVSLKDLVLENYTVNVQPASVFVAKKALTVSFTLPKISYVYGEEITPELTFAGFVPGEDESAIVSGEIVYYLNAVKYTEEKFNVGENYAVVAEGYSAANYTWQTLRAMAFNVTPKQAVVNVTTDKTEYVYGESISVSISYSGLIEGENELYLGSAQSRVCFIGDTGAYYDKELDAGEYEVSATGYAAQNYTIDVRGNAFGISKRDFVIRASAVLSTGTPWSKTTGSFDPLILDYGTFTVSGTLSLDTTEEGTYSVQGSALDGTGFSWSNGIYYILLNGGKNAAKNFNVIYDISITYYNRDFDIGAIDVKDNNLVYNGGEQSLGYITVENAVADITVRYSLTEGEGYALTAPKATDAGEYIVYYVISAEGYGEVEGQYTAYITKAPNKILPTGETSSYVYNGEEQTVDYNALLKADFGEMTVSEGTNVFKSVPVGGYLTFTVSVDETPNYEAASYVLDVLISNAVIELHIEDVVGTYGEGNVGSDVEHVISGNYPDDGCEFIYSYSYGGGTSDTPYEFTAAGTYTVSCTVSGANYTTVTVTYKVVVNKADFVVSIEEGTFVYSGEAQGNAVTVTALDEYEISYYYNGALYQGEGAPRYVDVGSYGVSLEIIALTDNYNDYKGEYTIVIEQAENKIYAVSEFGRYTYNGSEQTVDFNSALRADFGVMTVTSGSASFVNVPSGGVHIFTVSVTGTANYTSCSYEVRVNVDKADYTEGEVPSDRIKTEDVVMRLGRTLSNVELFDGFSWVDPSAALATGTFYAYYCADPYNYNPREVAVNVVARKENVVLSVSENVAADIGISSVSGLLSVIARGEGRTLYEDETALIYSVYTDADYATGGTYELKYTIEENPYYEVIFDGRSGKEFSTAFKIRSVLVGSVLYTAEDALYAASSGTVIVTADTSFASAAVKSAVNGLYVSDAYYTVKSGVTLLVPYDINYSTDTNTTDTAFAAVKVNNAFSKLVLTSSNTLTVNGKLIVNAKRNATKATTSTVNAANYGEMEIAEGATVILASGSVYESIGFTYGDGEIIAKNGSNVYEPLNMLNWKGGTISSNIMDDVFPLNQYSASSIIARMRVEYGATYYLKATIDISIFGVQRTDVKFAATGTDSFLQLSESSSYIYKYVDENNGNVNFELNGNVAFHNLSVTIRLTIITQTLSTSGKDIPIPGNIKVTVASGTTTIPSGISVKLLPGADIVINEGASVNIESGGKIYGYGEGCATFDSGLTAWRDGGLGRGYPYNYTGAYRVVPVMDYNETTPAVIKVAGILNADPGATLAAGIEGVSGGKVVVGSSVAVSGTIKEDNSPTGGEAYFYSTLTGKLISATSSEDILVGNSYIYSNGQWTIA